MPILWRPWPLPHLRVDANAVLTLEGRRRIARARKPVNAADQATAGEGKILYYQDPMHPWYRSDKPGIAPDCGMKLVPVYASDAPAAALPPGGVEISSARQQTMGVADGQSGIPRA